MADKNFKSALKTTDEIELTVTGRKSGREITNPIWFYLDNDKLYLLPVSGTDTEWYRNVLKNPTVTLKAGDASWRGKVAATEEPGKVGEVVEDFRKKYGAGDVKKYYKKLDVAVEVPLG
jgi:deazaflavin-dependent oxidoreductase (nitroreductase family)